MKLFINSVSEEMYPSPDSDLPPPPPDDDITIPDNQSAELPTPVSPDTVNDLTQEVTSYSSGDIEVQQATSSMADGMQLPVGGKC